VTAPPPEPPGSGEPPARRSQEPTDSEVDASFAALVAGWDEATPAWPVVAGPTPTPPPAAVAEPEPVVEVADAESEDEGHYEPPDPPPVPAPHRATIGALALMALGVFLLVAPGVIGLSSATGFTLALLSITGGLAWLLARLRPGPPTDSGWDDGAQL
jgi:hypothetical protein